MEPKNIRFGGGATETLLVPITAVWMLAAIVLILTRPRGKAITPFLLACFTIPISQVVVVGSLHFTVLRILIIAGLIRRGMTAGPSSTSGRFPGGFNGVDKAVVLWTLSWLTINSLQWMETQALIHNLGDFLDALGGYLVFRFLIPDGETVRRTIKVLAVICVVQGACMINEQVSHINLFGLLGGTLEVTIRDGKIRSGGVVGALGAGPLAGFWIPTMLWLWKDRKARAIAFAGLAGAIAMVITSNSSTSWMALGGSIIGLAFWPLRKQMRPIRWAFSSALLALHLVMNAPVWALIARIDLTGSSSGEHRYMLVDNTVKHFSDWWLLGCTNFGDWGWDMWDTCNQFVDLALKGGLSTLVCYIVILSRSFGLIGTARKQASDRRQEWLLWCLGSALFATVVSSFGVNYPAPMLMGLYPLMVCISVAAFEATPTSGGQVDESNTETFASAYGATGADRPFYGTDPRTPPGLLEAR